MKITLKNVKINDSLSEETFCFSASVYVDGKRVGMASNRGTGGPNDLDYEYKQGDDQGNAERRKIIRELEEKYDMDALLGELVNKASEKKWLKSQCRNKTLIKLDTDKENSWSVFGCKFSPKVKQELTKRYGKRIEIWGNEEASKEITGDLDVMQAAFEAQCAEWDKQREASKQGEPA